ncbi:MAG: hypothetical protein WC402_05160 [Candidatus Pacearchaeota archaeon]|jgi:hypothetical protein
MKIVLSNTIILTALIILGATFYFGLNNVSAENEISSNDTMVVEVDLVGFTPVVKIPFVGIQVQNQVSLGNLSKSSMKTKDTKVEINNTGNVDIIITPVLNENSKEIFNYLYFKKRTTSGYTYQKMGNWSMGIEEPDEEDGYRHDWFYMKLDLNSYSKEIDEDMLNQKAEIIFYAMPNLT